jgi:chromosome segregation ATPase
MASTAVTRSPPSTPPFARDSRSRRYSESSDSSVDASYSMIMLQEEQESSKTRELEEMMQKMKDYMRSTDDRLLNQEKILETHSTLSSHHVTRIESLEKQLAEAQAALSHVDEVEAHSRALQHDFSRAGTQISILHERLDASEADSAEKDVRIRKTEKTCDSHAEKISNLKLVVLATSTVATAGFGGALSGAIMGARVLPALGHGVVTAVGLGGTGYGYTGVLELNKSGR